MIKLQYEYGSVNHIYVEYLMRELPFTMAEEHYHSYYEIYYMISGQRIYFIEDRSYTVQQGDLVFIDKEMLHKTMQADDQMHERIVIHLTEAAFAALTSPYSELMRTPFEQASHVIRLPQSQQLQIASLMSSLINEIKYKKQGYELIPPLSITQLLLTTARYIAENEPVSFQHASPLHAKISDIARYINLHYMEPLKLDELAQSFYISSYYLSRMFKEVTGFTLSDYIALTRIKEAQKLLRESQHTISEVSEMVGYENFSHFGKMFKKLSSYSPREYRKQYQQPSE